MEALIIGRESGSVGVSIIGTGMWWIARHRLIVEKMCMCSGLESFDHSNRRRVYI